MNEAKKIEKVMKSSGLVETKIFEDDAEAIAVSVRNAAYTIFAMGRDWKDIKAPIIKNELSGIIRTIERSVDTLKKAESRLK